MPTYWIVANSERPKEFDEFIVYCYNEQVMNGTYIELFRSIYFCGCLPRFEELHFKQNPFGNYSASFVVGN